MANLTKLSLSEIVQSSKLRTSYNKPPKLPASLARYSDEELFTAISDNYCQLVTTRGISVIPLSGSEIEQKISTIITWARGLEYRPGLMLQGTPGNGKTILLRTLFDLYYAAERNTRFCNADTLYNHFVKSTCEDDYMFSFLLTSNYLFIDDLGIEPVRCMIYGTEYTPIQQLIDYRYSKQLPTFISTNYSDKMLLERYGLRCFDRIEELFTVLRFNGESYRHRINE